jgi:hypothetical protein
MILVATALFLAACATPEPTIQQGPDAETSFDGLVAIDNSAFSRAWIDPEVDLKSYNKVILGPAEFEFRAVKKRSGRSTLSRSNEREFWIDDKNRQKLIDTVTAVFDEELANSKHFTITDTPGPDVLILTGALLDIVTRVPPELVGRGEIYLESVGEGTLVLELADSLSGETIYRAADRRRIERPGREMMEANRVTTWAEVRRWARRWAERLVEGLDWIHE